MEAKKTDVMTDFLKIFLLNKGCNEKSIPKIKINAVEYVCQSPFRMKRIEMKTSILFKAALMK